MRDLLDPDSEKCNWCDHPRGRHVYPDSGAPECHDCKGGYCKPKLGRAARMNRQLAVRWREREK